MIFVSLESFKTRIDDYFKQVDDTGEELIIADENKPIVKISPIRKKKRVDEVFADVRGKIKYHQDIMKPETEWAASTEK